MRRGESETRRAGGVGAALTLGLALGLVWAGVAAAQVYNANIEVTAFGQDRSPLPGVTVRVVNSDTGLRRQDTTDQDGLAILPALPAGTYEVTAELDGFSPLSQEDVVLRVGQTVRLRFTLTPQMSEVITVTSDIPVVDVFRTDTSVNIVPEQIQDLPVADRNFERLAFLAPGVQRERGAFRFIQDGPVIGSTGNASQSSIFVDGVDFTDQALGLARTRFSQDAIREFRVVSNGFDAEYGGSASGALSLVTRTGGNLLAGSVFGFYRDDSLRATGALEEDDLSFSRYQVGATLGGPITTDKTHAFASVEYIDEDDIALFRPGGAFADQAADIEHPFQQSLALANLAHQFSDRNSASARFVWERYREDNFRVGGVADVSNGQELNRDNWNLSFDDTHVLGSGRSLNEIRLQAGSREYDEPTNSDAVEEWFSNGTTLKIGNNVVGDLLGDGDYWEVRETFHRQFGGSHDFKAGGAIFHVEERSDIPVFQEGLISYAFDDRTLPIVFIFGDGSADVTVDTNLYSTFVQDDWRPSADVTLSFGLRWDYDTDGNNPDFIHPLVGDRSADDDNFQPRFGFSWDMSGEGRDVLRGGAGLFAGRYLLVPSFTELQQNGVTGRVVRRNLNGLILGLPPAFWLDLSDPENTGVPLPPDIALLADSLKAPESFQASLGYTRRIGDTGLFGEVTAVYADGDDEIIIRDTNFGGNDNPVRLNPAFSQINTYTNEGHSEYKAVTLALNGTVGGGHVIASSVTFMDKENISDDFSPAFPDGYPSDPADIEAELGRSRSEEDYRVVLSAVIRLPWELTLAPIYEYGSGQPWNRILGYDFNGDGKVSDRAEGVPRNSEDGPSFQQLSLRLTKTVRLGGGAEIDLIAEAFNVFNETNFDVTSVVNEEFLAGPSLADPGQPFVPNPAFGSFLAAHPPREIQLGARYRF